MSLSFFSSSTIRMRIRSGYLSPLENAFRRLISSKICRALSRRFLAGKLYSISDLLCRPAPAQGTGQSDTGLKPAGLDLESFLLRLQRAGLGHHYIQIAQSAVAI